MIHDTFIATKFQSKGKLSDNSSASWQLVPKQFPCQRVNLHVQF